MSFDWIGMLSQASAQDKATAANQANARATNVANLVLNMMSRGGTISPQEAQSLGVPSLAGQTSAILPYYMSQIETSTGSTVGQISQQILNAGGTPAQQMQEAMNVTAGLQPSMNQAAALGQQVLSGVTTQQMLSEEQPVAAARLGVAETQKNTALEQLDKTLNDIDAIQARKGYSGDSYGNRLLKFNARAGILGQAAGNIATAKLQNAQEKQGIQQAGRTLQLQNLDLPSKLASSQLDFNLLPSEALGKKAAAGTSPLGFFNIGNKAFQEQNLPLVDYTSKTGLALSGLGSNASSALNYALQQQRFNALLNNQNTGTGTTPSYDPGPASAPVDVGIGEDMSAAIASGA